MRREVRHRSTADVARVFEVVESLDGYERWLSIVDRVVPFDPGGSSGPPAWSVTLRARVGRFSRAKRLRMVRTVHEPHRRVVFERDERDGRRHSPWRLSAEVTPVADGPGADLLMLLEYEGGLLEPVVSRVLDHEIAASHARLEDVIATS